MDTATIPQILIRSFQARCFKFKSTTSPVLYIGSLGRTHDRRPTIKPLSIDCSTKVILTRLNARSLLNKTGTLKRFLQSHSSDIILLTKTWLTGYPSIIQTVLRDCNFFPTRRTNWRGGGCLAYFKREFSVSL